MPKTLKKGEILQDRYEIIKVIGQGGMGNVYLASDKLLPGRNCALKEVEYQPEVGKRLIKQAREQFLREATTLARLDHPNLPKVSDFFSISNRDYLIMDFVPGEDLRKRMLQAKRKNEFIPIRTVLTWAKQTADALSYLHNQDPSILHRDIKPSNLKITPSGLIKLVDFGLVKVLAPGDITITVIQGQGTALYTPLEQYGGGDLHTDARSDIYAFGATLYHLLTNTYPIDAKERFLDPNSLVPPTKINPKVPLNIEKAILWAMELHPDQRPKNIDAFLSALIGNNIEKEPQGISIAEEIFRNKENRVFIIISLFFILISFFLAIFK